MLTDDRGPVTGRAPQPAEPVVRWPDPSPLDYWWTEIMDGVPPAAVEARSASARACGG
ncbi:hypothetical protein ACWEVD_13635 [Nocardia thailandica]|uniref:hypothetical protein n=1 Tax=Nocardia thailandica TaxID=257275 RepID=UPI0002F5851F|nr:hypothetical protein [Nocardia thailandica]